MDRVDIYFLHLEKLTPLANTEVEKMPRREMKERRGSAYVSMTTIFYENIINLCRFLVIKDRKSVV